MVDHPPKVLLSRGNITLAPVLDKTRKHANDIRKILIHEGPDQFARNFSRVKLLVSPRDQVWNVRSFPTNRGSNIQSRNLSMQQI